MLKDCAPSLRWLVHYLRHLHGPGYFSLAALESLVAVDGLSVGLVRQLGSLDQRAGASAFCAGADCPYKGRRPCSRSCNSKVADVLNELML